MVDQKPWQAFFDGHAPEYDDNCFTQATEAEVEFLLETLQLDPGASILDVGCGTGRHSVALARRGFRMTGIDLSAGMLAKAREKAAAAGVAVEFVQADAAHFHFEEPFDAAICLCEGAFGLLNPGDDCIGQPLSILRNVAASLKPGAPVVFTVLSAFRTVRLYRKEDVVAGKYDPLSLTELSDITANEPDPSHRLRERAFVPTELRLLFQTAGLEVEHIWGGTAGNWRRGEIDLDEYEIMVVGRKTGR